jgi:hypothetical protein
LRARAVSALRRLVLAGGVTVGWVRLRGLVLGVGVSVGWVRLPVGLVLGALGGVYVANAAGRLVLPRGVTGAADWDLGR